MNPPCLARRRASPADLARRGSLSGFASRPKRRARRRHPSIAARTGAPGKSSTTVPLPSSHGATMLSLVMRRRATLLPKRRPREPELRWLGHQDGKTLGAKPRATIGHPPSNNAFLTLQSREALSRGFPRRPTPNHLPPRRPPLGSTVSPHPRCLAEESARTPSAKPSEARASRRTPLSRRPPEITRRVALTRSSVVGAYSSVARAISCCTAPRSL